MVVLLISAVLMAIAVPQLLPNAVASNDQHAQDLAVQSANVLTSIFAQSQSYQCNVPANNMYLSQLEAVVPPNQLPWNTVEGNICNAGQNTQNAGNNYVITVYSWNGTGDSVGGVNYDSATAVAVTANANTPQQDCWFIIEHAAGGPPVFGYIDHTCASFSTCWEETPQAAPVYYAQTIGCPYEDSYTRLRNGAFPSDPKI
jgi:type II secretory pathway pseudopilin PulG